MDIIGGITRQKIIEISEIILKAFLKLPECPKEGRNGGFSTFMVNGIIPLKFEVGIATPTERANDFYIYSEEKVSRLHSNPPHISSWQTRNLEEKQYGGATRTGDGLEIGKNILIGFSGQPEQGDEAITLVQAIAFRWSSLSHARKVIEISENPFLNPLIKATAKYNIFN